ncbi:MAG: hypothetical protein ABI137_06970 [Antricoccus sp.]
MAETKTTNPMNVDYDAAADRIRDLNEKVMTAAKQTGNISLDAYEKTLSSMLDFEKKVAGASQLDFVTALASAHASFVTSMSDSYTKAAREALK